MKRNWSESSAVIEQRFDDLGQGAQWTPTGIGSPTLLEREADDYIQKSDQPGQYRIVSIWHSTASDFEPTRALEFLAGAATDTIPIAGAWRRVNWQPARVGFASKPGRWDDIAEAITFLHDRAAGEYRVVTVRRMLDAKRVTGRLKIGKHHVSGSEQAKYDAQKVFDAAASGEIEIVRRAFESGFDPATPDSTGRTVHPIAKTLGHREIELLANIKSARDNRPGNVKTLVAAIQQAAHDGKVEELTRLLDANPELINARIPGFAGNTALHRRVGRAIRRPR